MTPRAAPPIFWFLVSTNGDDSSPAILISANRVPKPTKSAPLGRCALAGYAWNVPKYVNAARRMADFTMSCQQPNGWFSQNDLDDHSVPLTHTLGYTLEGLLEIGLLLDDSACLDAVSTTLSQIQSLTATDGFLAGRWTADWKPAVTWCCLTGSSQLASVALRAHRVYPHKGFDVLGKKLLGFVASTQILRGAKQGLVGGIHGSYPFDGGYGRYCTLNWAAKFYADAVMDFFVGKTLRHDDRFIFDSGAFKIYAPIHENGQR